METDTVWQQNVLPTPPAELATACLTRSSTTPEPAATATDLLLVASSDDAGVETGDQLEHLRTELGGLGVSPVVGDSMSEPPASRAPFGRALALRGFRWGKRFNHSWRSRRGIVVGGGASLRDKLAVKAGIEAVIGVHGLIAFYVADEAGGDSSYIGADGDLALFDHIASLRGTASGDAVNRLSSAGIQVRQSSGILETPALAADVAVATARVLYALMPAGRA